MERRINVRGIVVDDNGQLLAVKHRKSQSGQETDYWAIPGGGLDVGEDLESGVVREFEEELGVTPKVGRLLFMQQFVGVRSDGSTAEQIELFFHIENASDFEIEIDLSATSHGHELARAAFIDPKASFILPKFLNDVDVREHIETNQPVQFFNNLHEPIQ